MIDEIMGFKIVSNSIVAKENIYCLLETKTIVKHPDVKVEDHYFDILGRIVRTQEQSW